MCFNSECSDVCTIIGVNIDKFSNICTADQSQAGMVESQVQIDSLLPNVMARLSEFTVEAFFHIRIKCDTQLKN